VGKPAQRERLATEDELIRICKYFNQSTRAAKDRLLRGDELTDEDIERLRSSLCRLRGILGVF